jgi:hypothetical protein
VVGLHPGRHGRGRGLLEPEAGQSLLAALEPLTRPTSASDPGSGSQGRADALGELARRALEGGHLPQSGGVRPQLTVTVDLDSLQGRTPGAATPTAAPGPRGLACDGAVTRVLVTHHPTGHHHHEDPGGHHDPAHPHDPSGHPGHHGLGHKGDRAERLQTAMTLLPPVLGGTPSQPLEVGRSSRVVQAAQRAALAVRDGG